MAVESGWFELSKDVVVSVDVPRRFWNHRETCFNPRSDGQIDSQRSDRSVVQLESLPLAERRAAQRSVENCRVRCK